MSSTDELSGISTNLSPSELAEVMAAIDEKAVVFDLEATTAFAESAEGTFVYKGAKYTITERYERTISLILISDEQCELPL